MVASFSGFPGIKYPGLWIAFAIPVPGHTNEEIQAALREEIEEARLQVVAALARLDENGEIKLS